MSEVMINKIDNCISCLQKLKDNERNFENAMDEYMRRTNLLYYKKTIKSLVEDVENQLLGIKNRINNMNAILNRKDVVITIFGSVSVGKSCLLNALLNEKIFRSAVAHTTSCFVTVKKGDDNCLMYRDKRVNFDDISDMKDKINELSSSLCKTHNTLQDKDVLRVFIKDTSKTILCNGVSICDTPGADKNTNIHNIIKAESKDSDIFIFMINNNITDVDRGFFRYQTETSVRPDIFIIVNKWDQYDSDNESATEYSKLSIIRECSKFIRKQKGGNEKNIESQIYATSTREVLDIRTNPQACHSLTVKQQQRYHDFLKFEERLQEYINNPEENKKRRYKSDIVVLESEINRIIREFKHNFNQWTKNSDHILDGLRELKSNVENFKTELKTFINNELWRMKNITFDKNLDVSQNRTRFNNFSGKLKEKFGDLDEACDIKVTSFFQKLDSSCGLTRRNPNNFLQIGTETEKLLREIPSPFWTLLYIGAFGLWALASGIFFPVVAVASVFGYFWSRSATIAEEKRKLLEDMATYKNDVDKCGQKIRDHYIEFLDDIYQKFEKGDHYLRTYERNLCVTVSCIV